MARVKLDKTYKISELDILNAVQDAAEVNLTNLVDSLVVSYGIVLRDSIGRQLGTELELTYDATNGLQLHPGTAITKQTVTTSRGNEDRIYTIIVPDVQSVDLPTTGGTYYYYLDIGEELDNPTAYTSKTGSAWDTVFVFSKVSGIVTYISASEPDAFKRGSRIYLAKVEVNSGDVTLYDYRKYNIFQLKPNLTGWGLPPKPVIAQIDSGNRYDHPFAMNDFIRIYYGDHLTNGTVSGNTFTTTNSALTDPSSFYGNADLELYYLVDENYAVYEIASTSYDAATSQITITTTTSIDTTISEAYVVPLFNAVKLFAIKTSSEIYTSVHKVALTQYYIEQPIQHSGLQLEIKLLGYLGNAESPVSDSVTYTLPKASSVVPSTPFNLKYELIDPRIAVDSKSILSVPRGSLDRKLAISFNLYSNSAIVADGTNSSTISIPVDSDPGLPDLSSGNYWLKVQGIGIYEIDSWSYDSTNGVVNITISTTLGVTSAQVRVVNHNNVDQLSYVIDIYEINDDTALPQIEPNALVKHIEIHLPDNYEDLRYVVGGLYWGHTYKIYLYAKNPDGTSSAIASNTFTMGVNRVAPVPEVENSGGIIRITITNHDTIISSADDFMYYHLEISNTSGNTIQSTTFTTKTYDFAPPHYISDTYTFKVWAMYYGGESDYATCNYAYTAIIDDKTLKTVSIFGSQLSQSGTSTAQKAISKMMPLLAQGVTETWPKTITISDKASYEITTSIPNPIIQFVKAYQSTSTTASIDNVEVEYDNQSKFIIYNKNSSSITLLVWIVRGE